MRALTVCLFILLLGSSDAYGQSSEDLGKKLEALFEDDWQAQMRDNPTWASSLGDMRYNDKLGDVSLAAYKKRAQRLQALVGKLNAFPWQRLSPKHQVNYKIFLRLKRDALAELEFQSYLTPITNRGGFHVSFPGLPRRLSFNTVKDYDDYIARLWAFLSYAKQHIALMREGIRRGHVLPSIVLEGFEGTVTAHIVERAQDSLLYAPFKSFPKGISKAEQRRLKGAGGQAIMASVVPGYYQFFRFMVDEYLPVTRKSVGISALPMGRQYYEHRVRKFTTLDWTPKTVHELGLKEVKRIRAEMLGIIKKLNFKGDFADFIKFLREDPRFYAKTPEQLMKEVSYTLKRMDGQLPKLFKRLPRMPYGIRKVPDFIAPRTTTAYYMRPSGDGRKAGFYYVNTYNLASRPLFEVEALSLHEAVPGHHLQIALQQELGELPKFRRFDGFTAFVEGWALYAERLGLEVGFYKDPYSDFGRLSYEMWRACRLVVDSGLHYFGWSRQRAIDFMKTYTALTEHNITTEVDRYIAWPGQALAYKTGELTIRRLRQQATRALGKRFDVRDFHDIVLRNGSVPLPLLESEVKAWVERQGARWSTSKPRSKAKLY